MGPCVVSCVNFNIPTDITYAAINTISKHSDYSKINPLTTDTTLLTYNATFNEWKSNNSSNSSFVIAQETLNGARNSKQQDNQPP